MRRTQRLWSHSPASCSLTLGHFPKPNIDLLLPEITFQVLSWQLASQCDATTLSPAAQAHASMPLSGALSGPWAVTLWPYSLTGLTAEIHLLSLESLPAETPGCFTMRNLRGEKYDLLENEIINASKYEPAFELHASVFDCFPKLYFITFYTLNLFIILYWQRITLLYNVKRFL